MEKMKMFDVSFDGTETWLERARYYLQIARSTGVSQMLRSWQGKRSTVQRAYDQAYRK